MTDDAEVCERCWRATCTGTCTGADPSDRIDLERRAAAIEAARRIADERDEGDDR
jgi:hypothetical protein